MRLNYLKAKPASTFYDNDLEALIPELWANESLAILEENMVASMLVHRDFEDEVAQFGDTVNTRRPGEFKAKRKGVNDDVTIQDANSTNVAVKLDQHIHTSFLIRDGEESKAFKDLVIEYLDPAVLSIAQAVDKVVLGQFPHFLGNATGTLGDLSGANAKGRILDTRNVMNINKAHVQGRNMLWSPNGETAALNTEIFLTADKVGDEGTALREASLGRKLGFDHYMAQNMSDTSDPDVAATGAIDSVTGYLAGASVLAVDGFSAAIPNNSWISVGGSPLRVVSTVGGATPTSITVASPGLTVAVADDAVVTSYGGTLANGTFPSGYSKGIAVDGFTVPPAVGQFLTIGDSPLSAKYTIIEVDGSEITLDRPLEVAIADDEAINIGPGGSYNLAIHKNALSLVTRPLAPPAAGAGALSAVVNFNGLAMRAVITYNGTKQGHLVTLDMLCGVKVLDENLGAVLLG